MCVYTLVWETGKDRSAVYGIKEVLLPSRQPLNQHLSVASESSKDTELKLVHLDLSGL